MWAQRVLVIAIIIILAIFLQPYFVGVIQRRDFVTCQSHVREIARGIGNYVSDWDQTLPVASTWMDSVAWNMAPPSNTGFKVEDLFRCPRDKSGAPSSYAYNTLLDGLPREGASKSQNIGERLKAIGRVDRAPLVIEKFGGARNAHVTLRNWNDVTSNMTLPHDLGSPTGSLITGDLKPTSRDKDQLDELRDKRF